MAMVWTVGWAASHFTKAVQAGSESWVESRSACRRVLRSWDFEGVDSGIATCQGSDFFHPYAR